MYWYRERPHKARIGIPPSLSSWHHLRFAWCCKIKSYMNKNTGLGLCHSCYELLADTTINVPLYTHFLCDGLNFPEFKCVNCHVVLIIQYPLSTCYNCTRSHLNLLASLENRDQDFIELRDPEVIYIDGEEFIII